MAFYTRWHSYNRHSYFSNGGRRKGKSNEVILWHCILLLHDYDMYKLFEDVIRGGISQVCGDRYVDVSDKNYISNNKIDMNDPNQEWLYYFDANNLYGHSKVTDM